MKILWFLFVLHTAVSQPGFGTSYLRNSRLCHQWSCLNTKLGLPDSLPPSEDFGLVLRGLLPPGPWQNVVDRVLDTCYRDRPRRYTNTCPGQALLQCTVDQLVNNCPEESLRKDDACAPVNSLAGLNNMFSQSRYENMERNMPFERRPTWFLKNYFNTKCCNLPNLIKSATLTECGFSTMMQYFKHDAQFQNKATSQSRESPVFFHYSTSTERNNGDSLQVVSLKDVKPEVSVSEALDCCDMSEFIQPAWRRECGFELQWSDQSRLTVKNEPSHAGANGSTTEVPSATVTTVTHRDLVVVPHSCEKETCVFNKFNITTSGTVDVEAFKKLLDNLTAGQPAWSKAKARVLTTCLTKPLIEYAADCEINRVLACTFDVLSENCPVSESAPKHDACKHSKDDRICQISSSKSRPKHRRSACVLPELVDKSVLSECGLHSLSRVETVVQTATKPKKYSFASWKHKCQDLTPSTSCLMSKMGVLNKYGFMDYFQMKDRIRHFTDKKEWSILLEVYLSAFTNTPLYGEHCNSAKKLLNVVDSMLMTCPVSKRVNSSQCTKILSDITNTPAGDKNATKEHIDQVLKHFHHVFFPANLITNSHPAKFTPKHVSKVVKKPIYDYGVLSSVYVPKVKVIDVKPKVFKKPLTLLPVYMRVPHSNLAFRPYLNDGVLRSPFALHNQIALAHLNSATPISTSLISPTPISTPFISTSPISTPFISSKPISSTFISTTPIFTPLISSTPISTTTSTTDPL